MRPGVVVSQSAYPPPPQVAYVTKAGIDTITGAKTFITADGTTPVTIQGGVAQTSELLNILNSDFNLLLSVDRFGHTSFSMASGAEPSTGTVEVAANGTQVGPLTAWLNNSGQVAAKVDSDGSVHSPTVKAYAGRMYARANFR